MIETVEKYVDRILSYVGSDDPWVVVASTPSRLQAAVAGRPRTQLEAKPAPDRWSVVEILAHLADAEIVGAWRIRSVLANSGTALQPYDQDRWAATFRYASADPFESIDLFRAARTSTLSLLRRVDPSLHDNYGVHGERGRETVAHIVRLYAGHDRNHVGQIERLLSAASPAAFAPAPIQPIIHGDGIPLDVRAGSIEAVEAIPESRKLMKLTVSFGDRRRTIVAGIRQERSDPQTLVGRQALFIVNIPPRVLAGVESQGMLFDLGHADGLTPVLAIPEVTVPDGTRAA
jgi:methionine--tRNA ligase beta chain